jgi:hypothetical protein
MGPGSRLRLPFPLGFPLPAFLSPLVPAVYIINKHRFHYPAWPLLLPDPLPPEPLVAGAGATAVEGARRRIGVVSIAEAAGVGETGGPCRCWLKLEIQDAHPFASFKRGALVAGAGAVGLIRLRRALPLFKLGGLAAGAGARELGDRRRTGVVSIAKGWVFPTRAG